MFPAANFGAILDSRQPAVARPRHVVWRPGWVSRGVALLTLALAIVPQETWACPNVNVTKTKTVKNTTGGAVGGVRFRCYLSPIPNCHAVTPWVFPSGFTSSTIVNSTAQLDFVYLGPLANGATATCGFSYYNGGGNIYIGEWWFTDNTGNTQIGPTHKQMIFWHGRLLNLLEMANAGPLDLKAKDIRFVALTEPLDPGDVAPTPALMGMLAPLADSLLVPAGDTLVVDLPAQPPNGGSSIVYFTVDEPGATDQPIDLIQTNFTVAVPGLSPVNVVGLAVLVLGAGVLAVRRRRNYEPA